MKKIISICSLLILSVVIATAQCSTVLNNFEIRLMPSNTNSLKIQMRYHANGVQGALQTLPTQHQLLDGLVFGITWPTASNVKITNCKSTNTVFDLSLDNTSTSLNKTVTADNIQTVFHNNTVSLPTAFGVNWTNDTWLDIAEINYEGTLATGDYFSLLNCDYGLAHPNSYSGNSTTDPWFALYDENGNYQQYSPKMITVLPSNILNTVKMYPIPTSGELTIEVETSAATNAVVKVIDLAGRLTKTVLFDVEKGLTQNQINISELANGKYLIQLTDGKALNYSTQVIKQ
jgi:hypothetical protein